MGENKLFTDDAAIFEHFDIAVKLVEASQQNIKITVAEDFEFANLILANLKLAKQNGDI